MNAEETEIFEFLKRYARVYVSVVEISKNVGDRRRFLNDRAWARPLLRRMEMDDILESNPSGEYRLKGGAGGSTTTFIKALARADIDLGDTTIISLDDAKAMEKEKQEEEAKKLANG
jgi:hypothetical protein